MDIRLDGKRALVTGAGKGIGRVLAKRLSQCGAKTVAVSRTQEDLDSLKAECPEIDICLLDVSDWSKVGTVVGSLGHFDLLVNNAGVMELAPILDTSEEVFDKLFNTNIKGLYRITQVVGKSMIEAHTGGAIVNVSSMSSKTGYPNFSAYSATKGGIDALTRVMAAEWTQYSIRTNCVNPTMADTPMMQKFLTAEQIAGAAQTFPIARPVKEEEISDAVIFLLSDRASYLNGISLNVDGGIYAT